ncbi:MAG: 2-oxoacid:acceptor oxidoreductase subunit alpha [Acidimicrobiia bacterium]|nr:2-oxoacid:acceptor oxidoreductase subunit alpha [Acidimicrobiia bacterium]MYC57839.1 2-oxoacid:acceptor oxidoreductase subunit alpha [Acidimicrobiia bacterium]MYG94740.1 2-oxoacid:acceptor oxidoreductase subunit alpha [Acidimicrobiia bacterium]MYI30641.1 2-oxoacid:acceptor oxidoreductase subunit alpha [Acidimicrobiia bacterium]
MVVRFAGDSGDGMQLTGDRFTSASAFFGNDLATLPEFPAEIRAPQGTLAGVSAFQVQVSDHDITTPGDAPNVLVAMNPAALRKELPHLEVGGTVIVNQDAFMERNLAKAGYEGDPLEDGTLDNYTLFKVPMTTITKEVCKELGVKPRDAERSKNFFALGLVSWLYGRPTQPTLDWIEAKFKRQRLVADANSAAFKAGMAFGETAELFDFNYEVRPAALKPGTYTHVNGNTALSWGLVAASQQAKVPLFLGSYPITPASDILHELSQRKNFGVRTLQAEDEIAAICSALGASFGGNLGVTTTSGPGVALKSETIGLAVSLELPLLIINIQRGGPSTGLPTKTESADLMQAMYGRHGESPVPIVAAYSPSQCFFAAIEAARIALKYRTPVFLLSDGYLANGSEPWCLPDIASLPDLAVEFATVPNHTNDDGSEVFWPYLRDPETMARPWAVPGTPELTHRIGGIEKEDGTGNINYESDNHGHMVKLRNDRIAHIANDISATMLEGDIEDAELLVVGWGSTWGAIVSAMTRVRKEGHKMAHAHITHLNPLPKDLGDILRSYRKVIVPEMNMGQLCRILRAEFLVDAQSISKVQGVPFTAAELHHHIIGALDD